MFAKLWLKSAATAVACGTVLAAAQVAAPATTVSSPQVREVGCTVDYPASVPTTASLRLRHHIGQYGDYNRAFVSVDAGAGTPTGKVRITVVGVDSWVVRLSGGTASHALPRLLRAQKTYEVRAHYRPGCSMFQSSTAAPKRYIVQKARGVIKDLHVRDISRGGHPVVRVGVGSSTGLTPHGKVRVRLVKNGHVRKTEFHRLHDGFAKVRFGRTWQRGKWVAKVKYLGNHNFTRAYGSTTFHVRRG